MARRYELKRRAERQQATRLRIVEAAIELHSTVGPANTTVSAIAERAGVQRHTYYRHFPDERSLGLACSGLAMERDPAPDPDAWRAIADPFQRLRRALTETYAYFARNEGLMANVLRDAETDPLTEEIVGLRLVPHQAAMHESLADGLAGGNHSGGVLAALDLALDFHTWRSLVRRSGVSQDEAVEIMVSTLHCLSSRTSRSP